jgi:hypothetical protein
MPYCPECRYEYKVGINKCPDCGTDLVEQIQEEEDVVEEIEFVPLPNLPGRVYAEMVMEVLKQKGIPCYTRSDGLTDSHLIRGTVGGVQLYVPKDRLDDCLDIQRQMMDHI